MITLDLRKIIYVSLIYKNACGNIRTHKPKEPSVHGIVFEPDEYAFYHTDYPLETNMERALRLGILDIWIPYAHIRAQGGVRLNYYGEDALKFWKRWNAHIYS